MKRKIGCLLLFSCLCLFAPAQTIDWSASTSEPMKDSVAKKILEPAKYIVTYTYRYARDAAYPEDKREGLTVLLVGDRYSAFRDYYQLKFDSICDEIARDRLPVVDGTTMGLAALKKSRFAENIVADRQKNAETVQRTAGGATEYEYKEDCPHPDWQMLDGDTIIAGYHRSKARTRLFGRDYTAWYAPELSLPYGPYKFGGLPGLILAVADTQDNFEFMLDGIEKAGRYVPIYLLTGNDIVKTSRATVRKIYKNYCADPLSALTGDGSVTVDDDVKATVDSKPYNPIELE